MIVLDASDHHPFGDDVGLSGIAHGEHEEPGKTADHAQRSPRTDGLRIIVHDHRGRCVCPTFEYRDGGEKNEHTRHHHHRALYDVGVNGRDDATGDTVENEDRTSDGRAGHESDLAERVLENRLKNDWHGENLGRQVTQDSQEEGNRSEKAAHLATVSGRHRVRERDGVEDTSKYP